MISKQTRIQRAEKAALRKVKCFRHRVRRCENSVCIRQIREDFYGTRRKKILHDVPKTIDVEALFRRLHEPISYDDDFSDDFGEAPTPVVSSPVLPIRVPEHGQSYSEVERKLTLRELIARKAA